jgi:hypothetical protein
VVEEEARRIAVLMGTLAVGLRAALDSVFVKSAGR